MRLQQTQVSSQQQMSAQQQSQQQQDDLFGSSSQLPSNQSGFRFGNQSAIGQSSQSHNADEFPPLSRNANGDMGQDRSSNMIQNVGFGAQSSGAGFGSTNPTQQTRNNGLLNALSGSNRMASNNRVASPASLSGKRHVQHVDFYLTNGFEGLSTSRSPVEAQRSGLGGESDRSVSELVCLLFCFQSGLIKRTPRPSQMRSSVPQFLSLYVKITQHNHHHQPCRPADRRRVLMAHSSLKHRVRVPKPLILVLARLKAILKNPPLRSRTHWPT